MGSVGPGFIPGKPNPKPDAPAPTNGSNLVDSRLADLGGYMVV